MSVQCRSVGVVLGDHPAVRNVTVAVADGEWLAILGPNGAGKSTLLRAMAGLVPATGEIDLKGTPLHRLSRPERARAVAFVPQAPSLPDRLTVADYVLLGRTPHLRPLAWPGVDDYAEVAAALQQLDLADFTARSLSSLSGGERQRAFLARALAQRAPVLLLDEPTTALDVGHQQQVLELVDQLRKRHGMTVVSTMHDLTLAGQYADRLLLLDQGRAVASGTPREVLTEENVARHYAARVRILHEDGATFVLPHRATATTTPGRIQA